MKKITSLQNTSIKNIVRLRTARARKVQNLTIVEGYCEVLRAVEAKVDFTEVYLCRSYLQKYDCAQALEKRFSLLQIPLYEVSEEVFAKISFGSRAEGIVAICRQRKAEFVDLKVNAKSSFLILEGIEKPGNLGAIFRTCDGAGVNGIILCEGCSDVYNPNVIRASIASVFSVKLVVATNEEAYQFLQSQGITSYAAVPHAKDIYTKKDFQGASAVVLGNEHSGLSDFWINKSDVKVRIPMKGIADSLNVSTSAAIFAYEILRQKS